MSLDKAMKNMKFDNRLFQQNMANGTLTEEELKKHLESLPDCANNAEKLQIEGDEDAPVQTH